MARIRFEGVTRHYRGAASPAVVEVDLEVADGEAVALVGSAGAGKTTLLRLACGLEVPDCGRVVLGDGDHPGEEPPELVLLFQNYAVHPRRRVQEYVAGATPGRGRAPEEAQRRGPWARRGRRGRDPVLEEVVEVMGLADLRRRMVSSLSASERMRMVLARSLVQRPDVLLLDEPFANLATAVRADLLDRLVAAQELRSVTTLYVTERREEAEMLAARVLVVEAGRVHEEERVGAKG